ncbi:hypothetical protein [Methyloceanibacter sp.]|uniref:hypothetical protein n=1 Tax=Methyloceanibacter sp. TaxID=1965321 RepID=UPI002CD84AD3|nr:hypothetical protein [Methyloceanibacter sp.]HML91284.1 hypothetical protein [Methyloceanibacter sp.]
MDEWILGPSLLEDGHGNQPDLDDLPGHRAADPFGAGPAPVFRKIERFERPP